MKFNTAWISLTYNCNNKCKWCYAASNLQENHSKSFKPDYEKSTLDLLQGIGIHKIILIGGEPTLYQNLPGFMREIRRRDINFGLVTNGRSFSRPEFSREASNAGLQAITVSLLGPTREEHDCATQIEGSFYESLEGIRTAAKHGIAVSTNTVITKENSGKLEEIVDLLAKEPVKTITFNVCGACISEDKNNQLLPNPREAAEAFERVHKYASDKGIRTKLVTPTPLCLFSEEFRTRYTNKAITGGPCQLTHGRNFVIDYNLDVVPCTHLTGFPMFNLLESGKVIPPEEFRARFENPNGLAYQVRLKTKKYPDKQCDSCKAPCTGGCPIYWINFDPTKTVKRID